MRYGLLIGSNQRDHFATFLAPEVMSLWLKERVAGPVVCGDGRRAASQGWISISIIKSEASCHNGGHKRNVVKICREEGG